MKILIACSLISVSVAADAALSSRLGGQAYYDDALDITWLANANAAAGSAYDDATPGDGLLSWANAMDWADSLSIGGVTDWRLASMNLDGDSQVFDCSGAPMESEADCKDNEYDHLFTYTGITVTSPGPFSGVMGDERYWSGSDRPADSSDAKTFSFAAGNPGDAAKNFNELYAWAVYDGDISAVPVPAAFWLFGSGLLGLLGAARRSKRE